jgi:hypothetical protein
MGARHLARESPGVEGPSGGLVAGRDFLLDPLRHEPDGAFEIPKKGGVDGGGGAEGGEDGGHGGDGGGERAKRS